ncbi:subtilase family-domain-containing protein, partial [Dimargaris cristalligena]
MSDSLSLHRSKSHPVKPIPEFPVRGMQPKMETQAEAFMKKYPEYDGRGTVIAILDTGVDPAAHGLQVTTDGKPKIIDIIDCTGSGDVIMDKRVKAVSRTTAGKEELTLQGLTGRTLLLSDRWAKEGQEFRVGMKSLYDLYPPRLADTLRKESRARMIIKNNQLLAKEQLALNNWQVAHPSVSNGGAKLSEEDEKTQAELLKRVQLLQSTMADYVDPGCMMDCIMFLDGEDWAVVFNPDGSEDLRGATPMRDYKINRDYQMLSPKDQMSVSVKIYDGGDVLSIVTTAGYHGTHVAAIAAANHPDEPEINGVAPGAQIISLKIGDHRISSMETGAGVSRAAMALIQNRCDLANMSYGEPTTKADDGYFVNMVRDEVIGRFGCIFVASAGNEGPGLSTTGCPGGTTTDIIGVGAYVGHSQMLSEYSLLEYAPETPFTWTSRGPTPDGDVGVDIYAPGSAITSYPAYTCKRSNLLNGTSMSSPNCCGCIALLVSALKANQRSYTPYRVKNAIKNSAKSIDDPFNVGFIQVDEAWKYLEQFRDDSSQDISFWVKLTKGSARGIYLREPAHMTAPYYATVMVTPGYMDLEDPNNEAAAERRFQEQFQFEKRVTLVCSASYVQIPEFVYLNNGGISFSVMVDPTQLTAGRFYFTEVLGYDAKCVARGPLFSIPVTICKPQAVDSSATVVFDNITMKCAQIERRFMEVPAGATGALIRLVTHHNTPSPPARFDLHVTQLRPGRRFNFLGLRSVNLLFKGSAGQGQGEEDRMRWLVKLAGEGTVELCLSQFWSGFGTHQVSLEVDFYSITLNGMSSYMTVPLTVDAGAGITRFDVATPVRQQEIYGGHIRVENLIRYFKPSDAAIRPLSDERDQLPDERPVMELVLTYQLKGLESNSYWFFLHMFCNYMYDTPVDNYALMVFDVRKKMIAYQGIYPKPIHLNAKGDYTIRVQVRHPSLKVLQELKEV